MSENNCKCGETPWEKPYKPNSNPNKNTKFSEDKNNEAIEAYAQRLANGLAGEEYQGIQVSLEFERGGNKPRISATSEYSDISKEVELKITILRVLAQTRSDTHQF